MNLISALVLVITVIAPLSAFRSSGHEGGNRRCQPVTIPMCTKLGWNQTSYPNALGHETQDEAGLEVHQFWPLVKVNCYPHLNFFLCALYTPLCQENYDKFVPPCKEVCQAAKSGCLPVMSKYGFEWPAVLSCDRLPSITEQKDGNICAAPPNTPEKVPNVPVAPPHPKTPKLSKGPELNLDRGVSFGNANPAECKCQCKSPFKKLHGQGTMKHFVGNVSQCTYPCKSPYLNSNSDHQQFLTTWIGIWSIACFFLSLFTVMTFVIEVDRFQYPERPIFVLAFCQMMVSSGYILRLGYGHEMIACEGTRIRHQDDNSAVCIAVFLLIYFFGMAASVWWVVLSLTWLLAAGFKWSSEAIASYAPWFHVFAWSLPALQTFIALVLNSVDGDPMSGICYVGSTNLEALRALVLGPLIAYLTLGVCFLTFGFTNLWRIRAVLKKQPGIVGKTNKLTQLMSKIGVFSVLYTIPALAVIAATFYESQHRRGWEAGLTCDHCPVSPATVPHTATVLPNDTYYLLSLIKYASSLIVGVTSGVWIFSTKTLQSWRRVFCSLIRCRLPEIQNTDTYHYQPADLIYVKSHTDVSGSQIYSSANIRPTSGSNHHHHHQQQHQHQQQQQQQQQHVINNMHYHQQHQQQGYNQMAMNYGFSSPAKI